jgi:hypothetical protein
MMKERAADWAPSDSLLDLVVEQYRQDDRDGDVTAFYDMLDRLPTGVADCVPVQQPTARCDINWRDN